MQKLRATIHEMRDYLILWLTQSLSDLGSAVTSFALVIWSYQAEGSALTTALLSVCSFAPYVLMSIFSGALSDRWNKKTTMLVCDSFAALTSLCVLLLLRSGSLQIWHLYFLNGLNGLMNSIQKPASDVTTSLLIKPERYQMASGLRYFSNSLTGILKPTIAAAVLALAGLQTIIIIDLITFLVAFVVLLFFIRIPEVPAGSEKQESVMRSALAGLRFLNQKRGVLILILFLSAINLTASIADAALPALILSREGGGEMSYGVLNTVVGVTMLVGSLLASTMPAPGSRVRMVCNTLLISMSTENLILALGRNLPVWCIGSFLGWIPIPLMGANFDVLLRTNVPIEMQGRVYSTRNTLQFFTIPLGFFLGGWLVDRVFEPFMTGQAADGLLHMVFGQGKGSGAAMLFFVIEIFGTLTCLLFRRSKELWKLDNSQCSTN